MKAWQSAACNADGAPFVVTAVISMMFGDVSGEMQSGPEGKVAVAQLAATFLSPEKCPGAQGISAEARDRLTVMMLNPRANGQ